MSAKMRERLEKMNEAMKSVQNSWDEADKVENNIKSTILKVYQIV